MFIIHEFVIFSKKLSAEEERELLAFRGESARLVGTSCALSPREGLGLSNPSPSGTSTNKIFVLLGMVK